MRVLVVKLWAMGDVIMALSVIPALRTIGRDVELTWVVGDSCKPFLDLVGGVDRIITVDERRLLHGGVKGKAREILRVWRSLAGQAFDLVVIGHSDLRYRIMSLPVKRRVTRSFAHGGRGGPIAGRYHGNEYARLVRGGDGPTVTCSELPEVSQPLPRPPFDRPAGASIVVLAPGGARNAMRDDPLRRWPAEMYAELARIEASRGRQVVLVGGEADRALLGYFDGTPTVDLMGRTSIAELAATMREADVVVTHDSLALHLARLMRAPIVAIFGPTSPLEKVPHRAVEGGCGAESVTVMWGGVDLPCRPCYDGVNYAECGLNKCMRTVSPEAVSSAIERIIQNRKTTECE